MQVPYLEFVRAELLAEFKSRGDATRYGLLSQCGTRIRKFKYRCRNRYCPCCQSDKSYTVQNRLKKRMSALLIHYPESVVVGGTFSTTACDSHEIRSRVASVKAALRQMFTASLGSRTKTLLQNKTIAAHLQTEVTPSLDDTGQIRWLVHSHLIALFKPKWPYKGRLYIHSDGREFKDIWRSAIGEELYLSALVEPAREPLAALRYATKASHNLLWGQYKDPRFRDRALPVELILARSDALCGLTLTMDYGLFNKTAQLNETLEIR